MSQVSAPRSKPKLPSLLSVVVPAYNEEEVLLEFTRRLSLVRQGISIPSEVIFVNDGSRDFNPRGLASVA